MVGHSADRAKDDRASPRRRLAEPPEVSTLSDLCRESVQALLGTEEEVATRRAIAYVLENIGEPGKCPRGVAAEKTKVMNLSDLERTYENLDASRSTSLLKSASGDALGDASALRSAAPCGFRPPPRALSCSSILPADQLLHSY